MDRDSFIENEKKNNNKKKNQQKTSEVDALCTEKDGNCVLCAISNKIKARGKKVLLSRYMISNVSLRFK